MDVRVAGVSDVADLARLLWRSALDTAEPTRSERVFASDLLRWYDSHQNSHIPFLALLPGSGAIGMAWLALVPRVPRPDAMSRLCGDIQSVYVLAAHRSTAVGTALIGAALEHATSLGLEHVTVHSNARAVSLYERAGFASSRELLVRMVP